MPAGLASACPPQSFTRGFSVRRGTQFPAGSEQFADSLNVIKNHTGKVLAAFKTLYLDLFDHRRKAYQKAIDEIKNRPEWETVAKANWEMAETLLSPLRSRLGSDDDRSAVEAAVSFGGCGLSEMESDLAAVEALKSSALVKLQELAFAGKDKPPIRRFRVSDVFDRPIQTQKDLDAALQQLRDALQKFIDEGAAIILE